MEAQPTCGSRDLALLWDSGCRSVTYKRRAAPLTSPGVDMTCLSEQMPWPISGFKALCRHFLLWSLSSPWCASCICVWVDCSKAKLSHWIMDVCQQSHRGAGVPPGVQTHSTHGVVSFWYCEKENLWQISTRQLWNNIWNMQLCREIVSIQ